MKIKKILKKFRNIIKMEYFNRINYINYYRKLSIDSKCIFLESQNARNLNGNIYYIAKELNNNEEYNDYKIYFSIDSKKYKQTKLFLKSKNMNRIILIKARSKLYFKLLASAKYLITDTSFTPSFIKKEGQVVFNTWHGTPLKTLGKKVNNEYHDLGNIQKNLVMSDYLLYPNEYMMEHMIEDYMLENIATGKVILAGYPRNEVFFDEELKERVRKEQKLEGKQVIAYMPTWRGTVSKIAQEEQEIIQNYLEKLDKNMKEEQILYVNLHPFVGESIDYSKFKHVKRFPKCYETYEFLSIADCLITDYSSVFFDFANTHKKIILFTYDEEEYFEERGLYIPLNSLPFPKVKTIEELIKEINSPIGYEDKKFMETYCKYDDIDVSKKLCQKVILNKETNLEYREIKNNGKENIMIFPGNLVANGITKSLINLLNNIDLNKRNYFVTYDTSKIGKNKGVIRELPEGVNYIPIKGKMNLSIYEKLILLLYKKRLIKDNKYIQTMKPAYEDEIKRIYGNIPFSTIIQFNGYDYRKILLYSVFKCNKVIYFHNDMYSEATKKKNTRLKMLQYACEAYDKVALVTEDLKESTSKIADIKDKIYVSNNIINYKNVLELAEREVEFDEKTESTVTVEELKDILKSDYKKFINIGRFSKEKGHGRLIEAFEEFWKNNKESYLIIIGGYGSQFEQTLERAKSTSCSNNIIIIKYVSNPYAILKRCDYFILPSLYEGFGLVITEADILGKPVVSTDITGPRNFMKKHGGTLVEDSQKGVYNGLEMLAEGKVTPMNVDYEKYNQTAISQFEELLK